MRQHKLLTVCSLTVTLSFVPRLMADYPIASHRYLADPASLVTKDRVYIYCSANYYVQQLFGQNSGDTYLAATIDSTARPPTLAASAVRDSKSGDTIVKIVNGANAPSALKVELAGLAAGDLRATQTVLTGPSADAYNEDGQPPAVKPVASDVMLKPIFDYEAPANSLTVFRIRK